MLIHQEMAVSAEATVPARERRARVLKQGFATWSGHFSAVECTIRDMTSGGARLVFADLIIIPQRFDLVIPLDGMEYPCEIAWSRQNLCGVRFTEPARRSDLTRRHQIVSEYNIVDGDKQTAHTHRANDVVRTVRPESSASSKLVRPAFGKRA